jgi:hypothetical protein
MVPISIRRELAKKTGKEKNARRETSCTTPQPPPCLTADSEAPMPQNYFDQTVPSRFSPSSAAVPPSPPAPSPQLRLKFCGGDVPKYSGDSDTSVGHPEASKEEKTRKQMRGVGKRGKGRDCRRAREWVDGSRALLLSASMAFSSDSDGWEEDKPVRTCSSLLSLSLRCSSHRSLSIATVGHTNLYREA